MTQPPEPTAPVPPELAGEIHRLVIMWAICCISPMLYLTVAWAIKKYLMDGSGYLPLPADVWVKALICLAGFVILLQGLHIIIRNRFRPMLAAALPDVAEFIQVLTKRTLLLILISEMAVFTGFCLFMLQGSLDPVFGSGVAAMLLYAQSHPRNTLPLKG